MTDPSPLTYRRCVEYVDRYGSKGVAMLSGGHNAIELRDGYNGRLHFYALVERPLCPCVARFFPDETVLFGFDRSGYVRASVQLLNRYTGYRCSHYRGRFRLRAGKGWLPFWCQSQHAAQQIRLDASGRVVAEDHAHLLALSASGFDLSLPVPRSTENESADQETQGVPL